MILAGAQQQVPEDVPMVGLPAAPRQLELVPTSTSADMPLSFFSDDEERGEYTGERLAARDPERYRQCVTLIAEGIGVRRIARLLGLSAHTIQAVREREPCAVATVKQIISQQAHALARLTLDGLRDQLLGDATISARDRAIIFGILTDKAELLSGGPTARVAVSADARHGDLIEYLERLRLEAARPIIDVREDPTGLVEETPAQRGAPDRAPTSGPAGLGGQDQGSRGYDQGGDGEGDEGDNKREGKYGDN